MLTVAGLRKSFGPRLLFDDVSLTLQAGERVGLVGPNGAGKSTLLKIILGLEVPDAGAVTCPRGTRFGYLPQESEAGGRELVLDIAVPHEAEADGQTVALAKRILASLGFRQSDFERPAGEMSGGWVMRAHLARLLVQRPDLLLLDEPTNHLDLETVLWLQEYLRDYRGALVLISHDREFLNELCTHVVELRQARALRYTGNYDDYLRQRESTEQTLQATHKAQLREIERLQKFVDRFRAKNTKATQAQSKLKLIERLKEKLVEAPTGPEATVGFSFPQPERSGQRVITLANVTFGYGNAISMDRASVAASRQSAANFTSENGGALPRRRYAVGQGPDAQRRFQEIRPPSLSPSDGERVADRPGEGQAVSGAELVYHGLNLEVERGQRIVLVGPNGAGKSTLLKLLAGVLEPQAGERRLGYKVNFGYYAQHRVTMFDASHTVLEEALDTPRPVGEQFARTVLGSFLFRGDDVFKPVGVLSGGEKSRLALVKLLLNPPNLLLMDEPTTHLDLASVDALIEALEPYEGTLVFISHDVHFLRALANHVVRVEDGRLRHFPGDYDYYLDKTGQSARFGLTSGGATAMNGTNQPTPDRTGCEPSLRAERKLQKRVAAEARQTRSRQRRELERRVQVLESEIAGLEARAKELVAELESPATYASSGRAVAINTALRAIHERLPAANAEWEAAATALSAFDLPPG